MWKNVFKKNKNNKFQMLLTQGVEKMRKTGLSSESNDTKCTR